MPSPILSISILSLALLTFLAMVIAWTTRWVYNWYQPACNGKLPPGSMGLPFFGETAQFLKPQSTFDVPPFIKYRMQRYGSLFKTNLLGQRVVISTDPSLSRLLFLQDGGSVELGYLGSSYKKLLGQSKLTSSTGTLHKYLRSMIIDHLNPYKQKDGIVSAIEDIVLRHLAIWSKQESVELKAVATAMSFEIASVRLLNYAVSRHSDSLKDKFTSLLKGVVSLPLDIPGFVFHKCLKDQREALRIIKDLVKERLCSTEEHADLLAAVIEEMRKEESVFDLDSAVHFLFGLLFASFETVSLAIALAIKFISEHPSVLKDLQDEHETILRNKANPDSPLTWKDYTSMTFTSHVIDETLRLSNLPPVIIRRALRDIYIDGYTIPAGWLILLCPPALHFNPEKYQDHLAFNPWRWKGQGSTMASKDFAAFGGGARQCAGAEFAKLQMSVLLHFLVTKYRWAKIRGGEIVMAPVVAFPNGLQLKVTKKDWTRL